jgi:hypothetical protein
MPGSRAVLLVRSGLRAHQVGVWEAWGDVPKGSFGSIGRGFSTACGVRKRCATYPAYLCPLHCGGAVSHSRLRTTILHSECGDCKRFLAPDHRNLGSPAQTAFEGSLR